MYQDIISFAESAVCFDNRNKLKLILFATGVKPNAYVILKVGKNLHDKHRFEELLKDEGILFDVSISKGYEEITKVTKNKVIWKKQGTWYGYDLFRNKNERKDFLDYVGLVKKQKHEQADKIAGKLYGYPSCCVKEFTKQHDLEYVRKNYTYLEYYNSLWATTRAFPFIIHKACKLHCAAAIRQNDLYKKTVMKYAKKFYKDYSKKKSYKTTVIVDTENDIFDKKGHSIWPMRSVHEYSFITQKPLGKHHYLFNHLTHATIHRGTVLKGNIVQQYNYADMMLGAVVDVLPEPVHQRKFTLLGRGH